MVAAELDELEQQLDPTARFVVAYLRGENVRLQEQLAQNGELIARLTEQLEALNRRLFGKSSEKIPTVEQQLPLYQQMELTVRGSRYVHANETGQRVQSGKGQVLAGLDVGDAVENGCGISLQRQPRRSYGGGHAGRHNR